MQTHFGGDGVVLRTVSLFSHFLEVCPVNMPDPIRKRFGCGQLWPLRPVMAITASLQPESGRIVYARSDFPHPIQFRLSKKGMDHIEQNRHGSDMNGLVRVWPNWPGSKSVCRNHRARFLAGCNRPATSFSLSDSVPFFHRCPE